MRRFIHRTALAALAAGAGLAGSAQAQLGTDSEQFVTADVTGPVTWTNNTVYRLVGQIYVKDGATLTIEPGTVIASVTDTGGSIAVERGAQIFAMGNATKPIIFTSTRDVSTWTSGDPKTGTWDDEVTEWGNLTVMGRGYVSEDATALGNSPTPTPTNEAIMEGLESTTTDPDRNRYGGGEDDDDSGTIKYVSLRFGGKVLGQDDELNGLSLGGVGEETDIHHIDIMNNVDDGVEIWGGKVNLKYVNIWNIGDDSFDVDQGWRGKVQFVCIVQGYGDDAGQGSGVGDNCFETDGGEDSDWQPTTTSVVYNATVIGQPLAGDHGTAWRDGARMQYRQCIFMNLGEQLVRFDNVDGDGGSGYGTNGAPSWADTWTLPFSFTQTTNAPATFPAGFYDRQTDGNLAELRDSIFFSNNNGSAYTEAINRGVFATGLDNSIVATRPIATVTRETAHTLTVSGLTVANVTGFDPRPVTGDAITAATSAPDDGFFTPVTYRGAFSPARNWLCGWTAADAYGFVVGGCKRGKMGMPNGSQSLTTSL